MDSLCLRRFSSWEHSSALACPWPGSSLPFDATPMFTGMLYRSSGEDCRPSRMLKHVDLEQEEVVSGKLKLLWLRLIVPTQTAFEEVEEEALQGACLEVVEKEIECF